MCHRCDKEVIEMGILESDIPNLPFTLKYWQCCVDGCKGKSKIRDYGIHPFYYWPVRIVREVNRNGEAVWHGGWINYDHTYICSRHFAEYKKGPRQFFQRVLFQHLGTTDSKIVDEYLSSKVIEIPAKKKTSWNYIKQ